MTSALTIFDHSHYSFCWSYLKIEDLHQHHAIARLSLKDNDENLVSAGASQSGQHNLAASMCSSLSLVISYVLSNLTTKSMWPTLDTRIMG